MRTHLTAAVPANRLTDRVDLAVALSQSWPTLATALAAAALVTWPLHWLLRIPAWHAFGLSASVGLIALTTLTPAATRYWPVGAWRTCVVGPIRLPPLQLLASLNDTSLNMLLFLPLGLTCGLLPRPGYRLAGWGGAALLSAGIEYVQYLLPSLGRVCSTADVMANQLGLAAGVLVAVVLVNPLTRRRSSRPALPRSGAAPRDGGRTAEFTHYRRGVHE